MVLLVKNPPANARNLREGFQFLSQEDPLKEEMTVHSSILIWRIPWAEEPSRLQSMGSQRVKPD